MNVFVGNLSWNTDEDALRQAFESYGEVEHVRIITDRETGRSRGFGFVTFTNQEDGEKAIAELNGTEVDGRAINVNEARERAPRKDRNFSYSGGGGGGGNRW